MSPPHLVQPCLPRLNLPMPPYHSPPQCKRINLAQTFLLVKIIVSPLILKWIAALLYIALQYLTST